MVLAAVPTTFAKAQNELLSYSAAGTLAGFESPVRALAIDYSGGTLAVGGENADVLVYDLDHQQRIATVSTGRRTVDALTFSRDGNILCVGLDGQGIAEWDRSLGQTRRITQRGKVRALAVSPDNRLLASSDDRDLLFWSLPSGQLVQRIPRAHDKAIRFLAFEDNGAALISVGEDRRIILWDVKNGTKLRESEEPDPTIESATESPGGELLILGTETTALPGFRGGLGSNRLGLVYTDRVKLYDNKSGMVQKTLENVIVEAHSVSLSADYKVIAIAERDNKHSSVGLWDVDRGVRIGEIDAPGKVTEVAFSPNGKWLVFGDERGVVTVYAVTGVQPKLAYTTDLRGRKYVITSPQTPLIIPTQRLRLAILNLDANGVDSGVSNAVADQLANRLAANPAVRLVERRRIGAILQEQNFQKSGRTNPATAVELARILNVQKVIMGSVSKLGTTMTITAQLVDVATAGIDGVREVQCNACSLEDLSQAVSELSSTLVAAADHLPALPAPPQIVLDAPQDGAQIYTPSVIVRGRVDYSLPLTGIELIVNGTPLPASRTLGELDGTKTTKLAGTGTEYSFVQSVPLQVANNVIAVRVIGDDGNDEQRYFTVRRVAAPKDAGPVQVGPERSPPLSLTELEDALANHIVNVTNLAHVVADVGIDFKLTPAVERTLRAAGADDSMIVALRTRH